MKLIRAGVPSHVARTSGETLQVRAVVNEAERRLLLRNKLVEEAREFRDQPSLEELADLKEVMAALLQSYGWTEEDLEKERHRKWLKLGGFDGGLVLLENKDPKDKSP